MNLKNITHVAYEFYRKNLTGWSWWIQVLLPLLLTTTLFFVGYVSNQTQKNTEGQPTQQQQVEDRLNVGYVSNKKEINDMMNNLEPSTPLPKFLTDWLNIGRSNQYIKISTIKQAEQDFNEGSVDAYIDFTSQPYTLYKQEGQDIRIKDVTKTLQNKMKEQIYIDLGLDDLQKQTLNTQHYDIHVTDIQRYNNTQTQETDEVQFPSINMGLGLGMTIILFLVTIIYVGIVVQEVAVERGTKIIEIILSSVSPMEHLYGKVMGGMMLVITHILIYVIYAIVGMRVAFRLTGVPLLGSLVIGSIEELLLIYAGQIGYWLLYLFLSILLYVILAVLMGSRANEPTDAQKLTGPIVVLASIGLYIGILSESIPKLVLVITQYIPVITPYIGPFVLGKNFTWVVAWGYIVALILGIVLLLIYAQRYYKQNILIYHTKTKLN